MLSPVDETSNPLQTKKPQPFGVASPASAMPNTTQQPKLDDSSSTGAGGPAQKPPGMQQPTTPAPTPPLTQQPAQQTPKQAPTSPVPGIAAVPPPPPPPPVAAPMSAGMGMAHESGASIGAPPPSPTPAPQAAAPTPQMGPAARPAPSPAPLTNPMPSSVAPMTAAPASQVAQAPASTPASTPAPNVDAGGQYRVSTSTGTRLATPQEIAAGPSALPPGTYMGQDASTAGADPGLMAALKAAHAGIWSDAAQTPQGTPVPSSGPAPVTTPNDASALTGATSPAQQAQNQSAITAAESAPGGGLAPPSGPAQTTSQPDSGFLSQLSAAASGAPPAPGTSSAPPPGATISSVDPNNSLIGKEIDPTAANRYQMAQDQFKTFAEQSDPQFQAAMRDATRNAAANGALGSGMLNTSYGDLAHQRELELQGERQKLFQGALEGTIGDQTQQRAELRGERANQQSLEQQAYDRAVQQHQQEQADLNSQFARGTTMADVGYSGNPASTIAGEGNIQNAQAGQSEQGLLDMIRAAAAGNPTQPATGSTGAAPNGVDFEAQLRKWFGMDKPQATPTYVDPYGYPGASTQP